VTGPATAGTGAGDGDPVRAIVETFLAARRGAGGEPERVVALSGDASTRRYYRVAGAHGSHVLALYPEPFDPETQSFLKIRSLLELYGLPAPAIVAVDGERGIVLQEDLGDCTLQNALEGCSDTLAADLYREAVDALVLLQREAARGPRSAECFRIAFDIEKLSWELHYFQKHFLEGLRGCDLSVEDRATLSEAFHGLSEQLASWPSVLCHRDYHSRNLMLHQDRLYWIDFQDARMGPATYDLASLLRDAYVDVPEDLHDELLERFRQTAVPEEARDFFRRRYDLMCVQRNLKALGTFGYMATVRGNTVYLPYIPRTLAHARRNLSRYPELERLWRTLARHVPELG
jgi:aminoglycoside/choline kinase family phosphotransferase